jgi:hypothetical protein
MPLHLTIEKGRPLLRPSLLVYWSQIALLAAALLIGVAQIAELPPFEGFDEIAHYSYIEQMPRRVLGHALIVPCRQK